MTRNAFLYSTKIYCSFLLLLNTTLVLRAQDSVYHYSFSKDSQLVAEGWMRGTDSVGYWFFYRNNGRLLAEGKYLNNARNGYWKWYTEDQRVKEEGHLINGKKEHWWSEYSEHILWKRQYVNHRRQGAALEYRFGELTAAYKMNADTVVKRYFSKWAFFTDFSLEDLQ